LLIDDSQTHECEFADVPRLPQPVEWNIGKPISFRVPLGNILNRSLVDRRWGGCGLRGLPRFLELRIRERNRHVIRAGDTSHSELKIGRTKGGKAAFIPFGRVSEQLNQYVVADVRLDI
jgi:hypothetical protein